ALFASPRPMAVEELAALDPEATPAAVQAALEEIREHYDVDGHGVALVAVGAGWQILTRPEYTEAIERAQFAVRPQRLSPAALETLAIIAYRQPIGRAEVSEIRGVDVGAVLKNLHERGLVDVVGRAEGLGRPLLYGTTPLFLEQFGLRHLEELPRSDELAIALRRDADPSLPDEAGADTPAETPSNTPADAPTDTSTDAVADSSADAPSTASDETAPLDAEASTAVSVVDAVTGEASDPDAAVPST
ncbi:MAG: SMC-Scp complex subunit ScpB, partial [Gemmatimonadota bacterium]